MYLQYFIIIDRKTGNWYPHCRPRENGLTFLSLTQSQPPRLFVQRFHAQAALRHISKNCPDVPKMDLQITMVDLRVPDIETQGD